MFIVMVTFMVTRTNHVTVLSIVEYNVKNDAVILIVGVVSEE